MFCLRLLAASCLVSALLACEEYELQFAVLSGDVTPLTVQACANNQTISYTMAASENFEEVSTLEDYELGYGATRVISQEACYVRLLNKNFGEQISYLKQHQNRPMVVDSDVQVEAVPVDDVYEELGEEMGNFCDDFPAYKLVKRQDGEDESERERQVSVTFQRCVLVCFVPVCYTTTLTVPTGSTITFVWFWFG